MSPTMHVVSHTHWDREWYCPFQVFRARLVDVVDAMLDLLQSDPDYRFFHLDGQTIVLEDYLEIRPEREPELRRLIHEGRVLVGPWYTQPDEFLVSGEAIVRNLMLGRRQAQAFGGCMELGYLPDAFGHAGQMPQIFAGFGFPAAIVFRGITSDQVKSAFLWRGADGTPLLAVKLPDDIAYSNYLYCLLGTLSDEGRPIDDARLEKELAHLRAECEAQAVGDQHLWMDGVDHIYANPKTPEILRRARRMMPDATILHTTLPAYIEALAAAQPALQEVAGELRRANRAWRVQALLANVASSHIRVKQANFRAQTALERVIEPLCAAAWMMGEPYPATYLALAWKYLLQNHAHDSICGCSVDQVHRDMHGRFDQIEQIAGVLRERALAQLAARVDTSFAGQHPVALLCNTLPWARSETLVVDVPVPPLPDGAFPQEIELRDAAGARIPHQTLSVRDTARLRQPRYDIPRMRQRRVFTLALDIDLPAYSLTALTVAPTDKPNRPVASLFTGPAALENEHLRVTAQPDGTLALLHKSTGRLFTGLLTFEDRGDGGEGWNWIPPLADQAFLSPGSPVEVARVADGDLFAALRVALRFSVPAGFEGAAHEHDPARMRRSAQRVALPIEATVSLGRRSAQLDIDLTVHNVARNHRLRVLFPTDIAAEVCHADGTFEVVERPIRQIDSHDWREPQLGTYPHHGFVCVGDQTGGLAVLTAGTPEYEVMDEPRRALAITLLRAFGRGPGEPHEYIDSQELGERRYRLALRPFAGGWEQAGLVAAARRFAAPPLVTDDVAHAGAWRSGRPWLVVEGEGLDVTAVKKCEARDSVLARVVNMGSRQSVACIGLPIPVSEAHLLNLNEDRIAPLSVADGSVSVLVRPRQIVTVELAPDHAQRDVL